MSTTPEPFEAKDEVITFNARMNKSLLDQVDERAKSVGLSRNKWLNKAIAYVLVELPTGATEAERLRAREDYLSGII